VTVDGQPDIALQSVGALVEGSFVRRPRVLGHRHRGAAVRHHPRREHNDIMLGAEACATPTPGKICTTVR